jgi:hypothetical protein
MHISKEGGVRNIFIEDGLVAFVSTYQKGYRSNRYIKIIHRYLPSRDRRVDSKRSSIVRWIGLKRDRKGIDEEVEPIRWTYATYHAACGGLGKMRTPAKTVTDRKRTI